MRMLIADFASRSTDVAREYFVELALDVDCAQTLDEARMLLNRHRYDVILTALHLLGDPPMVGCALARIARGRNPGARIVLMSPPDVLGLERIARECGVDVLIPTPAPVWQLAFAALPTDTRGARASGASRGRSTP